MVTSSFAVLLAVRVELLFYSGFDISARMGIVHVKEHLGMLKPYQKQHTYEPQS